MSPIAAFTTWAHALHSRNTCPGDRMLERRTNVLLHAVYPKPAQVQGVHRRPLVSPTVDPEPLAHPHRLPTPLWRRP